MASGLLVSSSGLAFELSEKEWLLGLTKGFGQKPLRRRIGSRDRKALLAEIAWAKEKLGLSPEARVVSCYEAGRDGFWLHRFLLAHGAENLVVDSASIEVNRKKRRAKSDRVDLVALLDLLARHLAGSVKPVWSVVHVPSVADEDRRHLHRELKLLKKDRTRVSHRMKGLLANQGLTLNLRQGLRRQLGRMRLWDGSPLPPGLRARLERYVDDYEVLTGRIDGLEAERRRMLREEQDPVLDKVRQLYTLRAVGINTAWAYGTELFGWRDFRNGKQVGSMAGLTPTPFDSGDSEREQGIGKDGSRWIRGAAIEFAWGWLRFQPESELSQWYQRRFGQGSKRLRKIGIVALARKLLVALWRFLETGVLPEGALLKTDLRLRKEDEGENTHTRWILVRAARDSCQVPERSRPLEGAVRPEASPARAQRTQAQVSDAPPSARIEGRSRARPRPLPKPPEFRHAYPARRRNTCRITRSAHRGLTAEPS